jgi:Tfp pilus assembly PilM family ATPase
MKKSTCVVGIDIGSYAIKIAGVRRAATPSLAFHAICEIPRGAD